MTVHTPERKHPVFHPEALAGQVALVTGGGTGIGRATALALAAAGARVFLSGRRAELLAESCALIRRAGGEAEALAGDLREPGAAERLVDAATERFGPVTTLINNAGGQFAAPAETITANGWAAVYRLSVEAAWSLSREVATRCLIPQRRGLIVFLAFSPRRGISGMVHATSARAALRQLAADLAAEWGRYGVRSIAVAPGMIDTRALAQYPAADVAAWTASVPLGRLGTPEEVADAIVFCASDAARYLTGITLPVDGGADAWGAGRPAPTLPDPSAAEPRAGEPNGADHDP